MATLGQCTNVRLSAMRKGINPVKPLLAKMIFPIWLAYLTDGAAIQRPGKRARLEHLYDSIAHGIAGQVRDRMQVELAHQVGAMSFSGLDAEIQSHRYLLAGLALCQQLNDFTLPAGQNVFRVFSLRMVPVRRFVAIKKSFQHHLADPCGEERSL